MILSIDPPPSAYGTQEQQLTSIRSYLYQVSEQLNAAMNAITIEKLAESEGKSLETLVTEASRQDMASQADTLKSLVVKTADTVQSSIDEIEARLQSDYVAQSEFGQYKEQMNATIRATADGIIQEYGYDSRLDALREGMVGFQSFQTSTNQYIKTGLLYFDDDGVPRYGVAVGEKLSTVEEDGHEVLTRQDIMATFTADRLTFWQGGAALAWIQSSELYINQCRIEQQLILGGLKAVVDSGGAISWVWIG